MLQPRIPLITFPRTPPSSHSATACTILVSLPPPLSRQRPFTHRAQIVLTSPSRRPPPVYPSLQNASPYSTSSSLAKSSSGSSTRSAKTGRRLSLRRSRPTATTAPSARSSWPPRAKTAAATKASAAAMPSSTSNTTSRAVRAREIKSPLSAGVLMMPHNT